MKNKIGIIGHFGSGAAAADGQTVKSTVLLQELKKRGFEDILCMDTRRSRGSRLKLLKDTLGCFAKCHTIIALPAAEDMDRLLPLLSALKKRFKCRVFHDVVGGSLAQYAGSRPKSVQYLKSLDGNWVEFKKLKSDLEELGIENCTVIANFKNLDTGSAMAEPTDKGKRSFCMFGTVSEEKGVTRAIRAVVQYNSVHDAKVQLEIWGTVAEDYKEEFEALLNAHSEIKYMGCVDFNKSVQVLTDHIALLFPTQWEHEGFSGTIIDSYAAAVPVIAGNWHANPELVKNFETGWVYPNEKISSLEESIAWAAEHYEELAAMRINCSLLAKHYSANYVMGRIINEIKG